jgi:hypothetical protein
MSTEAKVDFAGIVFRNTNAGTGRQLEYRRRAKLTWLNFPRDVKDTHPTKLVRYAETSQDPELKFTSGGTGSTRQVNLLIAKHV